MLLLILLLQFWGLSFSPSYNVPFYGQLLNRAFDTTSCPCDVEIFFEPLGAPLGCLARLKAL